MDKLVCNYCGQEKKEISFMIGAKLDDDNDFDAWTMHEGTGKISCANCYPIGLAESKAVVYAY